ncbi:partner of bursicon-like [Tachypleus tridentatus]|uniref:partner of bursicon-like n=1 Tax=Tachypleus tridentatus TaxID=6853 RepID=UPI003FD21E7D
MRTPASLVTFCLTLTSNVLFHSNALDISDLKNSMSTMDRTTCTTHRSEIHISKEEQDEVGNVVRMCEGTVTVTKCEGTCVSQIQPSVKTPSGFFKDCQCCRETVMETKTVVLKECFDSDGKRIFDDEGMMTIRLQEPSKCACHKCGH